MNPAWPLCEVASAAANSPTFMQGAHFHRLRHRRRPAAGFRARGTRAWRTHRLAAGGRQREERDGSVGSDHANRVRWTTTRAMARVRTRPAARQPRPVSRAESVARSSGAGDRRVGRHRSSDRAHRGADARARAPPRRGSQGTREPHDRRASRAPGARRHARRRHRARTEPTARRRFFTTPTPPRAFFVGAMRGTEELLDILRDIRTADQHASEMLGRHQDMLRSRPLEMRSVDLRAIVLDEHRDPAAGIAGPGTLRSIRRSTTPQP